LEKLYPFFLNALHRTRLFPPGSRHIYNNPVHPPTNPILLPELDYGRNFHWVIHPGDEDQQPVYGDYNIIELKQIYSECAPTYFVHTKKKTAVEKLLSKMSIEDILYMSHKAALKWDNQDLLPHKFNPRLVEIRNYWILTEQILCWNYPRILTVLTIVNYYLHLFFQILHMVVLLK